MAKSPDAFRTITEVSEWLGTPAHVLRFWESRFSQVKPVKRAGGRRYYRPGDVALLGGIRRLLHDDGVTIKGVQKILREKGVKYVSELGKQIPSPPTDASEDAKAPEIDKSDVRDQPEDDGAGVSAAQAEGAALADAPQWSVATEARVEQSPDTAFPAAEAAGESAQQERIIALYHRLLALRDRVAAEMSVQ